MKAKTHLLNQANVRWQRWRHLLAAILLLCAFVLGAGLRILSILQQWYVPPMPFLPRAAVLDHHSGEVLLGFRLSEVQLLQKLIDASAGRDAPEDIYRSIPKSQLDGLSLEQFQAYTRLIADCLSSQPSAFVPVLSTEKQLMLEGEGAKQAFWQDKLELSDFYWIESPRTPDTGERLAIAIQKRDDMPYLDATWITACLDLFHYAQIYVQGIHENNRRLVGSMLYSYLSDQTVRERKARLVIEQAVRYPTANKLARQITSLRPDRLRFSLLHGTDASEKEQHPEDAHVDCIALDMQHYLVYDAVQTDPEKSYAQLWTTSRYERKKPDLTEDKRDGALTDSRLSQSEPISAFWQEIDIQSQLALSLDDQVRSPELTRYLGPVLSITRSDAKGEVGSEVLPRFLHVRYEHAVITLVDYTYEDPGQWHGTVAGFTILGGRFRLGDEIDVRTSYREWLRRFPFSDRMAFSVKRADGTLAIECLQHPELDQRQVGEDGAEAAIGALLVSTEKYLREGIDEAINRQTIYTAQAPY